MKSIWCILIHLLNDCISFELKFGEKYLFIFFFFITFFILSYYRQTFSKSDMDCAPDEVFCCVPGTPLTQVFSKPGLSNPWPAGRMRPSTAIQHKIINFLKTLRLFIYRDIFIRFFEILLWMYICTIREAFFKNKIH